MPRPTKPCNMDPFPPVSPADNRPAVRDLLEKHSDDMESLRKLVTVDNPLYNADYHDDLWLLRFLLFHKKPAKAAKAALNTMKYRSEHGLDVPEELGWLIPLVEGADIPDVFRPYTERLENDAVFHTQPHDDRGVIAYIRLVGVDMTRMVSEVPKEELRATMRCTNEFYFRVLDEVTRRTGRLTKMVRLIDLDGITAKKLNRKFLKIDGQIAKEVEDHYPQLLGSVSVFNAPKVLEAAWKVIQYFFPAGDREMTEIYAPFAEGSFPEDAAIFKHVLPSNFPKRYGGESMSWPPDGSSGPPAIKDSFIGFETYAGFDVELLYK